MNGSHFSVFMMSVAIAYSAPQRKCISRRPGSYTDDSGRIVINNKNTNNGNDQKIANFGPVKLAKVGTTRPPRKRCCPYDFDSEKCQIVNDRKVCGYNMNSGGPDENPAEQTMNIGNGCWFRRGRLECGYQEGPYEGIRRPPVYDRTPTPYPESDKDDDGTTPQDDPEFKERERLVNSKPVIMPNTRTTLPLPSCVQIRRKIVCSTVIV